MNDIAQAGFLGFVYYYLLFSNENNFILKPSKKSYPDSLYYFNRVGLSA